MNKSNHQLSSEILAKALELPKEKAVGFINKECGSNEKLRLHTVDLYHSIIDEEIVANVGGKKEDLTSYSKTSIGPGNKKSFVIGALNKVLFDGKWRKIISLTAIYVLLILVGLFVRNGFKDKVVQSEKEKLEALLEIQTESVMQWVDGVSLLTNNFAYSKEIGNIAFELDEIVSEDPTYELLKSKNLEDSLFLKLKEFRLQWDLESISIIHKRDPIVMALSHKGTDKESYQNTYIQLDGIFYDYFSQMKDRDGTSHFPPFPDFEIFQTFPETYVRGSYLCFLTPIVKEGDVIGFFLNQYNLANKFSEIIASANHGSSVEVYSFSWDNKLFSKSRFEEELQKTILLNFDTTLSSIQSFFIKDPGDIITPDYENSISWTDMAHTKIIDDANGKVGDYSTNTNGSVLQPYRDYRGVEVVGAWRWIYDLGLGMIAEEDSEEAYIALRYFDIVLVLGFVVLALFVLGLFNMNLKFIKFGKKIEEFESLGQYKILEKLGEGGFGDVYKASHHFLKSTVAIKLLKKEFTGTDMLGRFEKEVKVTSGLSHPNTVKVYDYGSTPDGQFYYVMEYLNGVELSKVISMYDSFPVNRAIYVLLQVCYSLKEAHLKGLIHRDIKPANIMLCNLGGAFDQIKVLDFGLVKDVNTAVQDQTQINRIGGSPMFMAPERLRDPFNADQRVDVYSIGAVGLNMLSGQYVLELMSSKMMGGQETMHGDFASFLTKRTDVPKEFEELLLNCVHFTVNKRPASIEEVIKTLEGLEKLYPWDMEMARNWWINYDSYGTE